MCMLPTNLMGVIIKTKMGAQVVEAAGSNLKEAIELSTLLSECPTHCGACGKDNIAFSHRQAQGYDFYAIRCRSCGSEFALGQKREGGALFPKGPWEHPQRGVSRQEEVGPPPEMQRPPVQQQEQPYYRAG